MNSSIDKIHFLVTLLLFTLAACTAPPSNEKTQPTPELRWVDAFTLGIKGRGWSADAFATPYDRLPAESKSKVREPIWNLSENSSGLFIEFETTATAIHAQWHLRSERFWLHNMPASGVSGLDLYVNHDGQWRWLAVGIPKDPVLNTVELVNALAPTNKPRRYRLYLPLYNGLKSLRIGVAWPHAVKTTKRSEALPIAVYGTSIVQGAVASRPGMAYTAQLGRMLDKPVINLGFSGQCQMEPEMVELLTQITTDAFVIDCLPNMAVETVEPRATALIKQLHAAKPNARIVLVEHFAYEDAHLRPQREWTYKKRNAELRRAFEAMTPMMGDRLALVQSSALLTADQSQDGSNDATTDGIHPNDMGMNRIAKALVGRLR